MANVASLITGLESAVIAVINHRSVGQRQEVTSSSRVVIMSSMMAANRVELQPALGVLPSAHR